MWTETIRTLDDIDEMAFPRIAAEAEVAWSPATGESDLRTWESFRERVGASVRCGRASASISTPSDEIPWSTEMTHGRPLRAPHRARRRDRR